MPTIPEELITIVDDLDEIPDRLLAGIDRWIMAGIRPGSFLKAVLKNNLSEAFAHGDAESIASLPLLLQLLRWKAPTACSGSEMAFRDWRCHMGWEPLSEEEKAVKAKRDGVTLEAIHAANKAAFEAGLPEGEE